MRKILVVAAGVALLLFGVGVSVPRAVAFGVDLPERGVGSEHERITRAALAGIGRATLDVLAGHGDTLGAVGILDDLANAPPEAHCNKGDFLEGAYPNTAARAEAALTACRAFIKAEIDGAVALAKDLAVPTSENLHLDCDFRGPRRSAKCEVLRHLGRALHTSQDFYAHSNWVDQPAAGEISAANPPGLAKKGRALWLDLRSDVPFPKGLISGCVPGGELLESLVDDCAYGSWIPMLGVGRVTRSSLNKGTGPIGKGGTTGTGTTERGKINGNFRNAVAAAIEDTRDKWAYFQERVRAAYGADGETILCALMNDGLDAPACAKVAAIATTCTQRRAFYVDEPSSGRKPTEPTADERAEAAGVAERLKNSCRIEEADLTRDAVIGGGKADDGRAYALLRAVDLLSIWNACPADGRAYFDLVAPEHKEALLQRRSETPAKTQRRRREMLGDAYADCILDARLRELGR